MVGSTPGSTPSGLGGIDAEEFGEMADEVAYNGDVRTVAQHWQRRDEARG